MSCTVSSVQNHLVNVRDKPIVTAPNSYSTCYLDVVNREVVT